jgi:excinuclease ABC subunit C
MYKFTASGFSTSAGVYLMKDKTGTVIYVGKAKNLRKRLASYFSKQDKSPKTKALVERINKIDTITVRSELEAFLLENELIKKYRPNFNVVMRDDKSYLYIRITVNEEFPRILLARKVVSDGAKYFGPYASSGPVYEVLKLVKRTFPLCSANQQITTEGLRRNKPRACLNYHLKICPGVCVGKVKSHEYHKTIEQVIQFLHGNYPPVIQKLKRQMVELSAEKEFERAARIRDGLKAIEAINERQSVVKANLSVSEDAIAVARQLNKALIVLLQVRFGRLINQQQYAIDTKYETDAAEIAAGFMRDYYAEAADFPKAILLSEPIDDVSEFEKWLAELANRKIEIIVPTKGRQKAVVKLAQSNAEVKFNQVSGRWQLEKLVATEGVDGLKKLLGLKTLTRIEAYDISNTAGTDSVGAMVVWERGAMDKKQYRRFKIKTVTGPNDFASLAEVLKRRFAHQAGDDKFASLPEVVLIDGGKGQVSTIATVLKEFRVVVIGIAKGSHSRTKAKDDLVTVAGIKILPDNSPTKILLQNIRDEVHRFAIAYHANLRKKRTTTSNIEKVVGVGAATRKKLIKAFGSMAGVKRASEIELTRIVGVTMARKLKSQL